jgi:hypothetical protein
MLTFIYDKLMQILFDVFIHDPMVQTTKLDELYNWGAHNVATLALGSRPKQGLAKVWAKNEA